MSFFVWPTCRPRSVQILHIQFLILLLARCRAGVREEWWRMSAGRGGISCSCLIHTVLHTFGQKRSDDIYVHTVLIVCRYLLSGMPHLSSYSSPPSCTPPLQQAPDPSRRSVSLSLQWNKISIPAKYWWIWLRRTCGEFGLSEYEIPDGQGTVLVDDLSLGRGGQQVWPDFLHELEVEGGLLYVF